MVGEDVVHRPVLREAVNALAAARPGERWVDCTLGFGGHTADLLRAGASVTGLDQDPEALARATASLAFAGDRFRALRANFRHVASLVDGPIDGILADIGVSSWQLDRPERGFSFSARGPVDMRMDPEAGETALELVRRLSETELAGVLATFGEEPFARRIAPALKAFAAGDGPHDTSTMAAVVAACLPRKVAATMHHHPATRTFQALRIAVNDELGALDALLEGAPALLAPGGRCLIISFHSLEDRRVKQRFAALSGRVRPQAPRRGLPPPVSDADPPAFTLLTPHAVVADDAEVERNPRARSARLRALKRRPAPSESDA
ncbi:16S rRNA (cytosine(1402)-N(4))-methyltransferase RsmH [Myxococcota bacterium]|nr:16S rRNA (cytosine(1402)-N(4))-methyltransferase RsmH [Myxococcota bacterium]